MNLALALSLLANLTVTGNATMTVANLTAIAGDVITVKAGIYSVAPVPAVVGTLLAPLRYVAEPDVIVTSNALADKDWVNYYGFDFRGGITVTGANDSLVSCSVYAVYSPGTAALSQVTLQASRYTTRGGRGRR